MWQATFEEVSKPSFLRKKNGLLHNHYSTCLLDLCRRDICMALVESGCSHLSIKIFQYLDSPSLLAASLVCRDWQQFLLDAFYARPKFRSKIYRRIFEHSAIVPTTSRLTFSMPLARSAIIDVTVDDDLNIFALALLSGRPHVMSCSLFTQGKKRWVHRFIEHFEAASLTCISAGQSLVALGSKDGKIHVYESSAEFKCLRLIAILAHHTGAIHSIMFHDGRILSGSDDMTVGVVQISTCDGSLMLCKVLQGHVSRVRTLDCQADQVLTGSDDRSVKLWSIEPQKGSTPLCTLTGHSGPVTKVLLAMPLALSAAGSAVRVWNVRNKTCLKLLQHCESSVTSMTWISTFKGVATVDSSGILRTYRLDNLDTIREEIIPASSKRMIETFSPGSEIQCNSSNYSPKQSLKFYGSRDPKLVSAWPDNAILKLESIPYHFTAFSIQNRGSSIKQPCITLHCLDYVTMPAELPT